jgi:ribulose-5-phosphate 4-epimerase/fuculose-1-phosphate aldolase
MVAVLEADVKRLIMPELSPQAELAVLARALYTEGYDDHDVGHITYRQRDDTFLALPVEMGWNEMRASDIIRIDRDGNLLEGRWSAPPAIVLHLEFHKARPGCSVTVHQHPRYSTIWSAMGRLPAVYDQRAATLSDDEVVLYDDYEGIVEDVGAAQAAVRAVGDAKCALLRNHGVFVVGDSIAQAYTNAVTIEWRSRQAWFVEAIPGEHRTVPDFGRRTIEDSIKGYGEVVPWMWEWAVRRELGMLDSALS